MIESAVIALPVKKINDGKISSHEDFLACEEPLEIRLGYGDPPNRMVKNIAVTMRTPGNDFELAAGFLFTEGIIHDRSELHRLSESAENIIEIALTGSAVPDLLKSARNFYTSSSCGVCGKSSIESIRTIAPAEKSEGTFSVSPGLIYSLPGILRNAQEVFGQTGGLHAAALFDIQGNLVLAREDVGRHNALDKLIGAGFWNDSLPYDEHILLLSGRASFELVQKAAMAGIKMIAAVGAPSSLAVELAREFGLTLAGFVRDHRFNVYCGDQRIEAE